MDKSNGNHAEIFNCADRMNSQKTKLLQAVGRKLHVNIFLAKFGEVVVSSDGFRS